MPSSIGIPPGHHGATTQAPTIQIALNMRNILVFILKILNKIDTICYLKFGTRWLKKAMDLVISTNGQLPMLE